MTPPVLITGFHRSGTSAVARAFHGAGVDLGAQLLGADTANPYGHFEDEGAIATHDAALASGALTWKSTATLRDRSGARDAIASYIDERRSSSQASWGIKDPRLCLFLDEWTTLLPDAAIVFVVRAPGPTVASLHRRHIRRYVDTARVDPSDLAFWKDPDLGLKLWCHYHEQALPILSSRPSTQLINYSAAGSQEAIFMAIRTLGLTPDPSVRLDTTLGQRQSIWVHDQALANRAQEIWTELLTLAP